MHKKVIIFCILKLATLSCYGIVEAPEERTTLCSAYSDSHPVEIMIIGEVHPTGKFYIPHATDLKSILSECQLSWYSYLSKIHVFRKSEEISLFLKPRENSASAKEKYYAKNGDIIIIEKVGLVPPEDFDTEGYVHEIKDDYVIHEIRKK